MRRAPQIVTAILVVVAVAGCNGTDLPRPISSLSTSTTSAIPTSTLPPPVDCPGAGEFEEGGGIAEVEPESTETSNLGSVSWEVNDQCETFTFEFETSEGAPATSAPAIQIGHLESFQILRIGLGVGSAVVTDQLVETDLVDRLYVVRALDGGMFVDLHLAAPAAARAEVQSSPSSLTVELRPGLVDFVSTADIDDNIVLIAPTSGTEVPATTGFSGYARTFEANVLMIVTRGDDVAFETTTTAADWAETWGEFRSELTLPSGEVSVFVGEASPEDGTLDGITVDLTVS